MNVLNNIFSQLFFEHFFLMNTVESYQGDTESDFDAF
jgi:hypothetical protein